MSERPPTLPPEEDFAFVRDADSEEFPETWTPDACRRIKQLFEEVGWPFGINGSEKSVEPMIGAFMAAVAEEEDSLEEHIRRAGAPRISIASFRDIVFTNFCSVRNQLARGSSVEKIVISPVEIGATLSRMKKILGK